MEEVSDKLLKYSLEDAGFNDSEIKEFCCLKNRKNKNLQYKCLDQKREKILNKIHKCEKQISCIDYLKYVLEKRN